MLAEAFADGARKADNDVELVSLKGRKIEFCLGCLACQKTKKCVIKDDAPAITEKNEKPRAGGIAIFGGNVHIDYDNSNARMFALQADKMRRLQKSAAFRTKHLTFKPARADNTDFIFGTAPFV